MFASQAQQLMLDAQDLNQGNMNNNNGNNNDRKNFGNNMGNRNFGGNNSNNQVSSSIKLIYQMKSST